MILNFKTKKHETSASARVVDGKLILTFPDALSPVVWQMDLAQAKASALEVQSNDEEGIFTLKVKTPKGETVDVASFNQRSQALEGLMAASEALENAHGQIQTSANNQTTANAHPPRNSAPQKSAKKSKIVGAIIAILILFACLIMWSSVMPTTVTTGGLTPVATNSGQSPQSPSGVPMSADDFLSRQ